MHELSVLIPFDVGRTFVFRVPASDTEATPLGVRPSREQIEARWKELFPGTEWSFAPLSESSPLGIPATWHCPENLLNEISRAGGVESWSGSVTFFPNGIAILVLRGQSTALDGGSLRDFWSDHFKQSVEGLLKHSAAQFQNALSNKVPELKAVRRSSFYRSHFPYPIVFGQNTNFLRDLWRQEPFVFQEETTYRREDLEATITIGWSSAAVQGDPGLRQRVENMFVIGHLNWYSLMVMKRLSGRYLHAAFSELASECLHENSDDFNTIRSAYLEASSASQPILWSSYWPDLALLETLHRAWKTSALQTIIGDRTAMLQLHHDRLEEKALTRRQNRLAFAGVLIALFSLVSAIKDLLDLKAEICWPPSSQCAPLVAFWLPLVIGVLLVAAWFVDDRKRTAATTKLNA